MVLPKQKILQAKVFRFIEQEVLNCCYDQAAVEPIFDKHWILSWNLWTLSSIDVPVLNWARCVCPRPPSSGEVSTSKLRH